MESTLKSITKNYLRQNFHLLKWQQSEILSRISCALRKDHQLGALCSKRSTFSATSEEILYWASVSKAHLIAAGQDIGKYWWNTVHKFLE